MAEDPRKLLAEQITLIGMIKRVIISYKKLSKCHASKK
jgi:hypothetical protein